MSICASDPSMKDVISSIRWSRSTRIRNKQGRQMRKWIAGLTALLALPASAQSMSPGRQAFRDIYKELVETNTTLSSGSCTLAAERMAARLKAAGYPDADLHLLTAPDHPKE